MQIVFHIGVHCTDQDALIRSLLKNRGVLSKAGVAVPGPGRYRKVLSETLQRLRGNEASTETELMLLDAILDDDKADRVILSNESFICVPAKAIESGRLYPRAFKSTWLANAFPSARAEFAIGLRNPATFLPALYETLGPDQISYESFLAGADPRSFRWSDLIERLRGANPEAPVIAWCNEDTPIIWPEIMLELAGLEEDEPLEGALDVAAKIMSREGMTRLRAKLKLNPPEGEIERQRVVMEYLARFGLRDAIEQEISLPGWTDALVGELTEAYEEDMDRVSRIPGVTFLSA